MGNKLIYYMLFAMLTIPFVFWYWAIIVRQGTYPDKLTSIGFVSFFHLLSYVFVLVGKKDS